MSSDVSLGILRDPPEPEADPELSAMAAIVAQLDDIADTGAQRA